MAAPWCTKGDQQVGESQVLYLHEDLDLVCFLVPSTPISSVWRWILGFLRRSSGYGLGKAWWRWLKPYWMVALSPLVVVVFLVQRLLCGGKSSRRVVKRDGMGPFGWFFEPPSLARTWFLAVLCFSGSGSGGDGA